MAIRLPTLSRRLNQCKRTVPVSVVLKGKDQQGNLQTSHAKEYPLKLFRALAHAMADARRHFQLGQRERNLAMAIQVLQVYMPQLSEELAGICADFVDAILPIQRFAAQWRQHLPL